MPENIAAAQAPEQASPLRVQVPTPPCPPQDKIDQVARLISRARRPVIMAGNGVIRARASQSLLHFAEHCRIPVATTFMAKGAIPFSHPLSLGSIGLQSRDLVNCGLDRARLLILAWLRPWVEYHAPISCAFPKRTKGHSFQIGLPTMAEVDSQFTLG